MNTDTLSNIGLLATLAGRMGFGWLKPATCATAAIRMDCWTTCNPWVSPNPKQHCV